MRLTRALAPAQQPDFEIVVEVRTAHGTYGIEFGRVAMQAARMKAGLVGIDGEPRRHGHAVQVHPGVQRHTQLVNMNLSAHGRRTNMGRPVI